MKSSISSQWLILKSFFALALPQKSEICCVFLSAYRCQAASSQFLFLPYSCSTHLLYYHTHEKEKHLLPNSWSFWFNCRCCNIWKYTVYLMLDVCCENMRCSGPAPIQRAAEVRASEEAFPDSDVVVMMSQRVRGRWGVFCSRWVTSQDSRSVPCWEQLYPEQRRRWLIRFSSVLVVLSALKPEPLLQVDPPPLLSDHKHLIKDH